MKIDKITLDNGIRVISTSIVDSRITVLKIYIKVGSRDDSIPGLTHFLEHILFQNKSFVDELNYKVDKYGGTINANTTREYISIELIIIKDYFFEVFTLLLDLLFKLEIDNNIVNLERKIIKKEIKSYMNSSKALWDLFLTGFWSESPLSLPIRGFEDTVEFITENDLYKHYIKYFVFSDIVFSIAGGFDYNRLLLVLQEYFNNNKYYSFTKEGKKLISRHLLTPEKKILIEKNMLFSNVFIAYKIPGYSYQEKYYFKFLSQLLTGGSSSLLYESLREKERLVYSVSSTPLLFEDVGIFVIFTRCLSEHRQHVEELINAEIEMILEGGISNERFSFLKSNYRGTVLRKFEKAASFAGIFGIEEILLKKYEDFDSLFEMIEQAQIEDFISVLSNSLVNQKGIIIGKI